MRVTSGDAGKPVLQELPRGFYCLRLRGQWLSGQAHYYLCAKHLWPARPPPYSPKEPPSAGSTLYPDPVCPGVLKPRGQLAFLGGRGRLTHGGEVMPANTQTRTRAHTHVACPGHRPGTGHGGWGWLPWKAVSEPAPLPACSVINSRRTLSRPNLLGAKPRPGSGRILSSCS